MTVKYIISARVRYPASKISIFYYAIVVTVIAFILWFQGVSKVPASTAAVFTGIIPISAVFLSVIVLSEPVSLRHIFAVFCVFLGIVFITRSPSDVQPVNGERA